LSKEQARPGSFYFSTRDLLIITVLASLGGVASTYVNTLGDAIHAALGIPGAAQWAAGLHVIWIILGMGILRKPGTGVFIGLIKGAVELISGNSHGVIILLVDLAAGLLVDFCFMVFRKKESLLPYLLAGGLASASNVLIFQLFASIPLNMLGISAILILLLVAFISGIILSGLLPFSLQNAMNKAGVIRLPSTSEINKKVGVWIVLGVLLITVLLTGYVIVTTQGTPIVQIQGDVKNPYEFPQKDFYLEKVLRKMEYKNMLTEYSGYPLKRIIEFSDPEPDATSILLEASDGYAFLISFDELNANESILLIEKGSGIKTAYDIVGPESSKAWVRNVNSIRVISSDGLVIVDRSEQSHYFFPDEWVSDMDSAQIDLPEGGQKLQGVPVFKIIEFFSEQNIPSTINVWSGETISEFTWSDFQNDGNLRVYTIISDRGIEYVLAETSGNVLLYPLDKITLE
jgi:energy-coupling factor transport system substrate-specific component